MGDQAQTTTPLIAWQPFSHPQEALLSCDADEIFFGGARGGGKTDGMLGKFALKQKKYGRNAIGVFFRKTREDLKEAIERSKDIYGPMGAEYTVQNKQWIFRSGARLKFEYLERDSHAQNYQGHNYTDLFFEELTNWSSPDPINKLRATLRSGVGVPCQFHATGNPGGPGHQWVKARYIDPDPEGYRILWEEFENPFTHERTKQSRVFIPSKLSDNPTLMSDPGYVARLYQSGSKQLVRAWLFGDWNVVDGAFFDCWNSERHVVRPFQVPQEWMRFRSCDWGSAKPFSVGWWAVCPDLFEAPDGHKIPRGAIVRYKEWYGCAKDESTGQTKPDVGLKLTAEQVASGILERDDSDEIRYSVIDPAAFSQDGGPSIVERMRINFRRADNKRTGQRGAMGGWDQMRARMIGEDLGEPFGILPMMFVFSTCVDFIRTVPVLQHDERKPEDLDTSQEDHAADEARYGCMSRPYIPKGQETKTNPQLTIGGPSTMTFNDLLGASSSRDKSDYYD
jgi:hypothetical protein